jgi:hypothetical protein
MGLNPFRPARRGRADYAFVVATIVAGIVLLAWALLG